MPGAPGSASASGSCTFGAHCEMVIAAAVMRARSSATPESNGGDVDQRTPSSATSSAAQRTPSASASFFQVEKRSGISVLLRRRHERRRRFPVEDLDHVPEQDVLSGAHEVTSVVVQ